jgi:hypothetical protein
MCFCDQRKPRRQRESEQPSLAEYLARQPLAETKGAIATFLRSSNVVEHTHHDPEARNRSAPAMVCGVGGALRDH